MATLVSSLITSIRYYLKDTDTIDPSWVDDEILEYINQAQDILFQRLVSRKSDIGVQATTRTLVSGTENYAVPSNFWEHKTLFITGEADLLKQVEHDYILRYNDKITSESGVPTCFSLYNDYFYLRPIPDSAYTLNIYFYAQPTALTTVSNMPFKELYNQAIKTFAVAKCFLRDEFNIDKENAATDTLVTMADRLSAGRNKSLKRANAYRWEYEGLV